MARSFGEAVRRTGVLKEKSYFCVHFTGRIGGSHCVPGVCYATQPSMMPAVDKLVEDGMARYFNEEVAFVSGVAYSKYTGDPVDQAVSSDTAVPLPLARGATSRPSGRRIKV